MAAAFDEEILPITIPEAIDSTKGLILDVVRKNRTMIDYYIYPQETPSEIEAYRPRLQALYGRVESLEALDLTKLPFLVDNADALISAFILPIIDQVLNAIHGIQQIFINHYDRDLDKRKPYDREYKALEYREKQLKSFQDLEMRKQKRIPESLTPMPPSPAEPAFCRYAIAAINQRDQGKLSQVMTEDLSHEDRDRLRTSGGAYLSWDCPGCAFKLKYYVSNSMTSNIHTTDDVRSHASASDVQYRPAFLIKCHLYQAKSGSRDNDRGRDRDRKGSVQFDERYSDANEIRRPAATRRQSDIRRPRNSISLFGFPSAQRRRSQSETIVERYLPTSKTSKASSSISSSAKYGCVFCFAVGRQQGHMNYRSGRELAEHIESRHHVGRPPSSLMLEKFWVGLDGRCAENVRRWDLNIRSR